MAISYYLLIKANICYTKHVNNFLTTAMRGSAPQS